MEEYKIILTCANNYSERTLSYIPENFKGVTITQKFNWGNPMGYTPSASLETIRIITGDKVYVDALVNTYGQNCLINFNIYKIKSTGIGYDYLMYFKIDISTYVIMDKYSEFSLKSETTLDNYNLYKNNSRDFTGVLPIVIPSTQKSINYVSLKKNGALINGNNTANIEFEINEDPKIYNNDTALHSDVSYIYEFVDRSGAAEAQIAVNGLLTVNFTMTGTNKNIFIKLFKNNFDTPILTIAEKNVNYGSATQISVDTGNVSIESIPFLDNDYLFIGVTTDDETMGVQSVIGELSVELYVRTETIANQYSQTINYIKADTIFDLIFSNRANVEESLKLIGVTSAQTIMRRLNYVSFIPKDFVSDFCLLNGAVVNFKNDGSVDIKKMDTFFGELLVKANAIELTDVQDFEISFDSDLHYISVSAGMEQKTYDTYTYFGDWNKVLTFKQRGKIASENINLSPLIFRCDYSGLIDYATKKNKTVTNTSKDLFVVDPAFPERSSSAGTIYEMYTPRDIMTNWRTFLEYCFCNYGRDNLWFESNSGDDYNLEIEPGYFQFDDFSLSDGSVKILPLKAKFSSLIGLTDFSEKILKVVHDGIDYFIFVKEAKTTDKLNEQEIIGNLIYFSE